MEFNKVLKKQLKEAKDIFDIKDYMNVNKKDLAKFLDGKIGKNNWRTTHITEHIHGYRMNKKDDNRLLALMLFQYGVSKEECVKCYINIKEKPYYEAIGMDRNLYKRILKEINEWESVICIEKEEKLEDLTEAVYTEITELIIENGFKKEDIKNVIKNRNGVDFFEWRRI